MSYQIQIQQFEGPLPLLLYLVRKDEMNIFDINIHEITRQYLNYIRWMRELDLEVAGDFIQMAATLIQIKSRMLLPQYNAAGEEVEEPDDPRRELVKKLLELERFQRASTELYALPLLGRDVYVKQTFEKLAGSAEGPIEIDDENALFGLIQSYRRVIKRASKNLHRVGSRLQSIGQRIGELKEFLKVGERVRLMDLIYVQNAGLPRAQLLISFLSVLELAKIGYVKLFQNEPYSDLWVEATADIGDGVLALVEDYDSSPALAAANAASTELS